MQTRHYCPDVVEIFTYVARFVVDKKTYRGVEYRKHVKGHITVFLNDVQGLSTHILPHPLLKTMETVGLISQVHKMLLNC
jgi:hypothetical protein